MTNITLLKGSNILKFTSVIWSFSSIKVEFFLRGLSYISKDKGRNKRMLKTIVFDQIKRAMKEKDVLAKGVLTILKSALDSAEKEKGSALSPEEEIAIVNREVKQTNQALDGAKAANREDLIEKENAKLKLLASFLPTQLSEEEIVTLLTEAGVVKGMNMGDAMKIAKPILTGKTDGSTMSKVVKSII